MTISSRVSGYTFHAGPHSMLLPAAETVVGNQDGIPAFWTSDGVAVQSGILLQPHGVFAGTGSGLVQGELVLVLPLIGIVPARCVQNPVAKGDYIGMAAGGFYPVTIDLEKTPDPSAIVCGRAMEAAATNEIFNMICYGGSKLMREIG